MADVKQIKIGTTVYDVKDVTARTSINNIVTGAIPVAKATGDGEGNSIAGTYAIKVSSAATIEMSVDPKTYIVTAKLKNSAGTAISTASIDLPIESVVVSGEYDEVTKEIVLTLQNGSEVRFGVADLVSGLASETGTYPGMAVGQATKATQDASGNVITATYATKAALATTDATVAGITDKKADKDGTYPDMTVGSATVAVTANKVANALTVQKNGVTVATYNGGTATTANLIVPTKVSDLTNDSGFITSAGVVVDEVLLLN